MSLFGRYLSNTSTLRHPHVVTMSSVYHRCIEVRPRSVVPCVIVISSLCHMVYYDDVTTESSTHSRCWCVSSSLVARLATIWRVKRWCVLCCLSPVEHREPLLTHSATRPCVCSRMLLSCFERSGKEPHVFQSECTWTKKLNMLRHRHVRLAFSLHVKHFETNTFSRVAFF